MNSRTFWQGVIIILGPIFMTPLGFMLGTSMHDKFIGKPNYEWVTKAYYEVSTVQKSDSDWGKMEWVTATTIRDHSHDDGMRCLAVGFRAVAGKFKVGDRLDIQHNQIPKYIFE